MHETSRNRKRAAIDLIAMTGVPISRTLRGRSMAAPVLPARTDARALVRERLTSVLDDARAAAAIEHVCESEPRIAALVAGVIAHSPFLTRIMRLHPDWLLESLDDDPDDQLADILARGLPVLRDAKTLDEAMQHLRTIRLRVALHVALADLSGVWSIDRVTEALSMFADAAVDAALRIGLREAQERGRITLSEAFDHPDRSGIVILAMGKHGARELNYSSDIDLIVLFDPDAVPLAAGREPLDEVVRIIKTVVRVLHEPTGAGYVFRTDLRLRPDPASTPIAVPIGRAIGYYQTVGQNWERAALIKARPVAGDMALGERFLAELTPFIWRRYFDYAAIADIHAMKRQIHAHKGGETIAIEGHDVKLGRGGIREIEFFVQTQQLIFGGKKPALRARQTLAMLPLLHHAGWIGAEAVVELSEAYRFLRMVEHRLQMVEDQQTQKLPKGRPEVDAIARFCGMAPPEFRKTLTRHFRNVERHYARLFEDAPALSSQAGNLVFTGSTDDPETLKTLKRMGFQRSEMVVETVRGWHFGRRSAITTPRAREVLTELTPALLEAFGKSSDPDGALIALDNALQGMPAVVELLTILKQNAALRALFAEILGNAPRLSEVAVQRPHVLDALLDPEFADPANATVLADRFQNRLSQAPSFEDFLDQARDLARAERFMAGARLLSGIADPLDLGQGHADIAEAALKASLDRVTQEMTRRYGTVPGGRMAIVALGKFGGREMTAASDLDLMVLYDNGTAAAESDGEKPIYASEWHARLTQRLVTALTAPTQRGTLYDVDLRLRPSGSKGPIAGTLGAFAAYHAGESETWERMALTRARLVAGDAAFGLDVMEAIGTAIGRPVPANRLAADIRAMRRLIEQEKPGAGPFDVKLAPGGLVDIEFAAQYLMLRYGAAKPELVHANTCEALKRLVGAGALTEAHADALQTAWRLQSGLAQLIALGLDAPFRPESSREPFRKRLARAAELPDFKALEGALKDTQRAARAAMTAVLA
jgi:[glutamine synthetase] adenylyltransferase / [glutamine synthetase]-adenylyl-L-tyrosine phosphorylase